MRRVILRRRVRALNLSKQAGQSIEKHFYSRFGHLVAVRRFVSVWLLFWILLGLTTVWQLVSLTHYFQTIQPVPGGIYNEGILGTLTNVNPIYATSEVDTSLSQLIFAGLMTYNSSNQLVGDLASGYSVDSTGTVYTVTLRPNLKWQDNQPLTAADVVFTIDTIQNSDAQSPLFSSWQGISVSQLNPLTVQFKLPNPLASFPYNLTVGIIPKHLLDDIQPADLRSASFNTNNPVGAGPFAWHAIEVSGNTPQNAVVQIALLPYSGYALGEAKLNEFIVHAYADQNQLISAFTSGQLSGLAGLGSVPSSLKTMSSAQIHSLLLTAGTYVFFKTQGSILSDANIRKALVLASSPSAIINKLGYPTIPVSEPLLYGQLAFDPKYSETTNQQPQAAALLNSDGWILAKDGYRYKAGQQLEFNLVTTDTPENRLVEGLLAKQWRSVGVNLMPVFESPDTYSIALADHNYDATLDGISIGNDPDVFVYWDNTQYDPRSSNLNLSEYNNSTASAALEEGRTRLDPALRIIKYQPFLAAWQQDAPALGLYQPREIYITNGQVFGLSNAQINAQQNRFNNVSNWEILTAGVTDHRQT
ncbi:MAG: ABC transporter substrate-binding protein [Candidatus Saccharimonadales bacterium]